MPIVQLTELKDKFKKDSIPQEQDFTNLIDTLNDIGIYKSGILGQIILWSAPTSVPDGWMSCSGQLLDIVEYPRLFALIGTTYGGDGSTNFALPNLFRRIPMMEDVAVGTLGGTSVDSITASAIGSVSITEENLPAHDHLASFTAQPQTASGVASIAVPALIAPGTTATNLPGPGVVLSTPGIATAKIYNTATADTTLKPFTATVASEVSPCTGSVTVGSAGSGEPLQVAVDVPVEVSTIQPYIVLNYIISVNGVDITS